MIQPLAALSYKCRRFALAVLASLSGLAMLVSLPAVAGSSVQPADRTSYILFTQGSRSTTMSGSTEDLGRARAVRVGLEGLLYVRQGGAAYVIRDSATLRRAEAIFEPQNRLGGRQAELGSRQAELGKRQATLGAEQARLGLRQAGATPRQQNELGRQQDELGRRQNALGQQQGVLGRQQSVLGREQARLAREADARFRALVAEALQRGVARRVD